MMESPRILTPKAQIVQLLGKSVRELDSSTGFTVDKFDPEKKYVSFLGQLSSKDDLLVEYGFSGNGTLIRRERFFSSDEGRPLVGASVSYMVGELRVCYGLMYNYDNDPKMKGDLISINITDNNKNGKMVSVADYGYGENSYPTRIFFPGDEESFRRKVTENDFVNLKIMVNDPRKAAIFVGVDAFPYDELSPERLALLEDGVPFSSQETQPYSYINTRLDRQQMITRINNQTGKKETFSFPDIDVADINSLMRGTMYECATIPQKYPVNPSI